VVIRLLVFTLKADRQWTLK